MDLEKMIAEVAPQVRANLERKTAEQIAEAMSYTLRSRIAEHTEKYITEHVLPDVTKQLQEQHDVIVAAVCESVAVACNGLRDALIAQATKRLTESHQVAKISDAIFGKGY